VSFNETHLVREAKAKALVTALTCREMQVLHLMVDGYQSKDIARYLDLSPRTVEIHRHNVIMKLGVRSSLAAASIGALAGLGECSYLERSITEA
jgi:two-component system response regulator FixJ